MMEDGTQLRPQSRTPRVRARLSFGLRNRFNLTHASGRQLSDLFESTNRFRHRSNEHLAKIVPYQRSSAFISVDPRPKVFLLIVSSRSRFMISRTTKRAWLDRSSYR